MSVKFIGGAEWGDEAKGKVSDLYMDECDASVRACGGGNAGHVVYFAVKGNRGNIQKIALHLLSAGALHDDIQVVLGRGMVTHIPTLINEIDEVRRIAETDPLQRLQIAPENHILFDAHKKADAEFEKRRGKGAIGTTHSGIGPATADKALRVGMRMETLLKDPDAIAAHHKKLVKHWAQTYKVKLDSTDKDKDMQMLLTAKEILGPTISNMTDYWRKMIDKRIIIEGAQGYELSVNAEGYPYVTAGAISVASHLEGAQLPLRSLSEIIMCYKAYVTRVGNGDFPTRMAPSIAERTQKRGGEQGSTTGRLRDVGWQNIRRLKDMSFNERPDGAALAKIDVLDGLEEIFICVDDRQQDPLYVRLPGWQENTKGITRFEDLPENAQNYLGFLEKQTGMKHKVIGTGPGTHETIDLRHVAA